MWCSKIPPKLTLRKGDWGTHGILRCQQRFGKAALQWQKRLQLAVEILSCRKPSILASAKSVQSKTDERNEEGSSERKPSSGNQSVGDRK